MITSIVSTARVGLLPVVLAALFLGLSGCGRALLDPEASRHEGVRLYKEKNYVEAAGAFENATRQDPRDYEAHYYLGCCWDALNEPYKAFGAYQRARDVMQVSLRGQADTKFRLQILDSLAALAARTDARDTQLNTLEQRAREGERDGRQSSARKSENYLLVAKIYRLRGDADKAIEAYRTAARFDASFIVLKESGLYQADLYLKGQLKDGSGADRDLRRAHALNDKDPEVAAALRRMGVVPGPSLKNRSELADPIVPRGPLPEVNLGRNGNRNGSSSGTGGNSAQLPRD